MSAVLRPAEVANFKATALSDNHVRIYITRDVAFNLEKMNRVTKNVLGKLGCDECHSGRILDFTIMENFLVNPKTLEVNEINVGP